MFVLLLVGGVLVWYHAPAQLEAMDGMLYCACGYSKVAFKDGKITMVKYHHDTMKSGDLIGRYTIKGHDVQLEVNFNGKVRVVQCRMDNIGLLAPAGSTGEYQALNSESLKLWIYRHLHKHPSPP
ncbi:MAG: hypothetical protein WC708_02240 [Lentisphaeria bacterium]